VLVNNAAEQHPEGDFEDITDEHLLSTYQTNIFSFFRVTRAAMKHLQPGDSIINTTSVTAYRGSQELVDYSSTKGAITSFTRSLAKQLAEKGHPRERRGAGAHLDAPHPGHLRRGKGCQLRPAGAHEAARPTLGSRAGLRVPGLRRRFVLYRPGTAPQRRRSRQRVRAAPAGKRPSRTTISKPFLNQSQSP
jgi:NAD(P)-dependent dehydrogenase (short-subunit alcohol dehydrogenase family)